MLECAKYQNLFWKLAAFYATYFLVFGVYMPYWPLWLDGIGLSAIEIGWVLAGAFWIKVVVQPWVAHLADKNGQTRLLTASLMGLSAVGFFSLSHLQSFWPVLLLTIFTAACYQPVLPVMESVVLHFAKLRDLRYGHIRLWGSITFIIATIGAGWWLEGSSSYQIIWLLVIGVSLVSLSCLAVPNRPKTKPSDTSLRKYHKFFFTTPFIFFIITVGLIHVSHSVLYGFGTLYWRELGHTETVIGIFWSVGVLAEIVLFSVASRYDAKFGYISLLVCASLATVVRWPLLAIFDTAMAIIFLQTLHGLTFGAAHLGAMSFLARSVPSEVSATGQSLYYTLIGGVFSGCMLPVAGKLYSDFSGDAFYFMSVLGALSLVSVIFLSMLTRQNRAA